MWEKIIAKLIIQLIEWYRLKELIYRKPKKKLFASESPVGQAIQFWIDFEMF